MAEAKENISLLDPVLLYGVYLGRLVRINNLTLPDKLLKGKKVRVEELDMRAADKGLDVVLVHPTRTTTIIPKSVLINHPQIGVPLIYVGEIVPSECSGVFRESYKLDGDYIRKLVSRKKSIGGKLNAIGLYTPIEDISLYLFFRTKTLG